MTDLDRQLEELEQRYLAALNAIRQVRSLLVAPPILSTPLSPMSLAMAAADAFVNSESGHSSSAVRDAAARFATEKMNDFSLTKVVEYFASQMPAGFTRSSMYDKVRESAAHRDVSRDSVSTTVRRLLDKGLIEEIQAGNGGVHGATYRAVSKKRSLL